MNPENLSGRVCLYPLWLRIWHWSNAALFLMLMASGISLHFSDPQSPLIPFAVARVLHNLCGLALLVAAMVFMVRNHLSGNRRHYRPEGKNLLKRCLRQADFYTRGIFAGESHPFPPTWKQKFNPLQQLTYLGIMYGAYPVLIGTGLLLWLPNLAPEQIWGMGGLWPAAVLHYLVSVGLAVFFIGHLYLATIGKTLTQQIEKMITGWEEITAEQENGHEQQS